LYPKNIKKTKKKLRTLASGFGFRTWESIGKTIYVPFSISVTFLPNKHLFIYFANSESLPWPVMVWAISLLVVTCLAVPSLSLRHAFAPEDVFRSSQDSSLREVFQVYPPPISPKDLVGSTVCSFTLMNHVFGNSAGKPFIGNILSQKFTPES
jgi:hypothetical protein